VNVTCPKCRKTLSVPESSIGKTITCPACKAPVKVEEKLEIISDGPSAPPPMEGPTGAGAGLQTGNCPNCGMPLVPTMTVCNRCGTNRFTGAQDKRQAGYQASGFKKLMGRSGWVFTLVVLGAIVFGIYMAVTKSREWAEEQVSDGTPDTGKQGRGKTGAGKQSTGETGAGKQSTGETGAGKQSAGETGAGKQSTGTAGAVTPPAEDPVNREEQIAESFEEAFALLMDPLPESQKKGREQLGLMGADAVPHVAERYSESEDAAVRLAMVHALARLDFHATTAKLAEAIGDEDDGVREAAIKALGIRGVAASDTISEALGSDDSRVRSAAIRIAGKLGLAELAPDVIALLEGPSALVRWQAAKCLAGRLATEEAYPKLIAALDDDNLDVAVAASKALAGKPKAMPLVLARLEKLADERNPEDTIRMLCLLAGPILASRDMPARTKLAVQVCADRPLPRLVSEAKKLLAAASPGARLQAMTAARKVRESKPPMPVVACVSLMDRDVRIRTSAIKYLSAFPSEQMLVPLVIAMGDEDIKIAMLAAREIDKFKGGSAIAALRAAAKGVEPLRVVLAAGLLARREDDTGAEALEKAAARELKVLSPVPAWAAYQLSFLGDTDLARRFVAEAEMTRSLEERAYYTVAAARLGDQIAQGKLKSMLADRRTPADIRVDITRLLSEDAPEEARQALLDMLDDSQVAIAALTALADTGDEEIVPEVIRKMPSLTRDAAEIAMSMIVRFGRRAEDGVLTALSSDDRRLCMTGLEIMTRLAKQTSKTGVKAVVTAMMKHQRDASIKQLASVALKAMTGRRGRSAWTWREWAKELGVTIDMTKAVSEESWGWITFPLPGGWKRRRSHATGTTPHGTATVTVRTERDPTKGDAKEPASKRRYRDSAAMMKARKRSLTYEKEGDRYVPRANVSAKQKMGFFVGSGRTKIRASTLLFTNKVMRSTTYYIFLVHSTTKASWYAEIECRAESKNYKYFKNIFEKDIAHSIKIDEEMVE